MRTKIYITLLFILMAAYASAQKDMAVYHVSGGVNILTGSKSSPAKRSDIITGNNSLQVKQGGSCMLIEQKGKSLQVAKAGTYSFATLKKMMSNAGKEGVSQKFFSYVYESLFDRQGEKLSVTPVVFRGDDLMGTPADNTIIIADAFTLTWKKPAGKIPVRIAIITGADEKVFDTVLKSATALQVNITANNFLPGTVYKWKAEESDTHQPKEKYFYFLVAEKKDRKEILKEEKLLQDKSLPAGLKQELQGDIFQKWKQHYQ